MTMATLHAAVALGAAAVFALIVATVTLRRKPTSDWRVPVVLATCFGLFSVATVAVEGPLGFWAEHTRSLWGNQVWIDLLFAVGIAWAFILPRARRVGMSTWPWLGFVVATGCIGLGLMVARCLYLEKHTTAGGAACARGNEARAPRGWFSARH
jgi:hypothetical protein